MGFMITFPVWRQAGSVTAAPRFGVRVGLAYMPHVITWFSDLFLRPSFKFRNHGNLCLT